MELILEYLLKVKVIWSHAHKSIPWTLLGLYFKRSDEHTHNFYLGVLVIIILLIIKNNNNKCLSYDIRDIPDSYVMAMKDALNPGY